MNKEQFIVALEKATTLDQNQCTIINSILENHFILGKQNKAKIITDIATQLKMNEPEAEKIYEAAMSAIGDGIKNRLKHPFGAQN